MDDPNKAKPMNKRKVSISVIIPVYNEENTIGDMIRRTKDTLTRFGASYEVLVVDDGSVDGSPRISSEMNARVLKEERHHGKGYVLKLGFKHASGSLIVTLDSDGSHQPEEIGLLLDPMIKNKADFVIGSRFLRNDIYETKIPRINKIGLNFFNILIRILTGVRVSDSQSGFRAMKSSIIKELELKSSGYEIESEMLVKALKTSCRVTEVPITFRQRTVGKSKLDPVKDGMKILFSILESYLC